MGNSKKNIREQRLIGNLVSLTEHPTNYKRFFAQGTAEPIEAKVEEWMNKPVLISSHYCLSEIEEAVEERANSSYGNPNAYVVGDSTKIKDTFTGKGRDIISVTFCRLNPENHQKIRDAIIDWRKNFE